MTKKILILTAFAFVSVAIALVFGNSFNNVVEAADCTVDTVVPADIATQPENTPPTKNWVYYVRAAATGSIVNGPGNPPLGNGSFELNTPTGADKGTLFNFDHINTPLADINQLGYSTYRTAGNLQQVAALNIQVDINGAAPGGFTTLVFEPVYNTSQGAVVSNTWQTWDAFQGGNAVWWSSNPIPSAPNRDTFVSWNTIVAANPNAVIVGGFGINQGSGNPALITATDALSIGYTGTCITYNFELFETPANAAACKNNGWKTLRREDGSTFKNQGDCVSYTNNGK